MSHEPFYAKVSPVTAGLKGCCPRCGRGRLFKSFLEVAPACSNCGLEFAFADAGDGAAWFVMLIAGFAAVGGALGVEVTWQPPYWVHAAIAIPLGLILPVLLLRPVKGMLICQQYATNASEGRRQ